MFASPFIIVLVRSRTPDVYSVRGLDYESTLWNVNFGRRWGIFVESQQCFSLSHHIVDGNAELRKYVLVLARSTVAII